VPELRSRLAHYGLSELALASDGDEPLAAELEFGCLRSDEVACESELLLDLQDYLPAREVDQFRRSALIDIDPGLRQLWMAAGRAVPARHDAYFTIGETVGTAAARFPDCGLEWHYTPPAVFLPAWPVTEADLASPYTTVAHWWGGTEQVDGQEIDNDKRTSFLQYLDVPSEIPQRLGLALGAGEVIDEERAFWGGHGWDVTDAWEHASTPWDYQRFIQRSRGEFSCAKPSCMLLENAWISDRTLCYLASGKPAVVQDTGASGILPDAEGLLRFRTPSEAIGLLREAESDYARHSRAARRLAEKHFDATKVAARVLERALGP